LEYAILEELTRSEWELEGAIVNELKKNVNFVITFEDDFKA